MKDESLGAIPRCLSDIEKGGDLLRFSQPSSELVKRSGESGL